MRHSKDASHTILRRTVWIANFDVTRMCNRVEKYKEIFMQTLVWMQLFLLNRLIYFDWDRAECIGLDGWIKRL